MPDRVGDRTGAAGDADLADTFDAERVDVRIVLVDRQGKIRGYYGTSEDDPTAHLIADIRRLARESS